MQHKTAIIFDMDGVLVDTLATLYQVYLTILKRYQVIGCRQEFDRLNGPNMEEVVEILTSTHKTLPNKATLLNEFHLAHSNLYANAELVPEALDVLKKLAQLNIPCAIASAATKHNIQYVLDKFSLNQYFQYIVSGDDVKFAKPHPEIYQKAASLLNSQHLYAIDDSPLGVTSALMAGVPCIQFCQDKPKLNPHAAYHIEKLTQLMSIVQDKCQILIKPDCVNLNYQDFDISAYLEEIEYFWQKHKQPSMFDGDALFLTNFEQSNITVCKHSYKTTFYLLHNPDSKLNQLISPIAVSGIVIDENNNTLLAKRSSQVTQYPGYYECPPSGGIETNLDHQKQLLQELKEETQLVPQQIDKVNILALVKDKQANQIDILCRIKLNTQLTKFIDNNEYTDFKVIAVNELMNFSQANLCLPECSIFADLIGVTA